MIFRSSQPKFPRSSVHNILKDRAYIGELLHKGEWYPGKHEPLIGRATWIACRPCLAGMSTSRTPLNYAGDLIQCGHCGHPISGEKVRKKMKSGERSYTYYRHLLQHDRLSVQVAEAEIDQQVLAVFDKMWVDDEEVRDWFRLVLASQTRDAQDDARANVRSYSGKRRYRRPAGSLAQPAAGRRHRSGNLRSQAHRNAGPAIHRSSCNWMCWTARMTKPPSWLRKFLNFRKPFVINGLPPTMPQSVVCSKSCS